MKRHRSILSLLFAVLVLVSSSSFVVGAHFCGGDLKDVALFSKAKPCAMEKQIPACHQHESKPCCEDENIVHDGQDFKVSSTVLNYAVLSALELELPAVFISEIIPDAPVAQIRYYNYDPPLWSSDLTVSLQVFLI